MRVCVCTKLIVTFNQQIEGIGKRAQIQVQPLHFHVYPLAFRYQSFRVQFSPNFLITYISNQQHVILSIDLPVK